MVLTRLSHLGEVCPLGDHSYSDPLFSASCSTSSNRRIVPVQKLCPTESKGDYEETSTVQSREFHILDFPSEILEKIFSYLPFKNIGEIRMSCKRLDKVGSIMLNIAFQKLQTQMLNKYQTMKAQMPRRESARRKHPLARESDILETLHMRLSLLQMTFGKHIERKHCCFFAGEILDEVYRILRCMKSTPNMGKVFKITDELFDLSAMAMEYFKEHIEPSLPEISYFGSEFLEMTKFSNGSSQSSSVCGRISEPEEDDEITERECLPPSNMVLRKRIRKIRQGMKRYNSQLSIMAKQLKTCRGKVTSQSKQIVEQMSRMEEYDKKMDETSRKLSTVLQELNKCRTEIQYWRSKSPAHHVMYCSCGRAVGGDNGINAEAVWIPKDPEEDRSHPIFPLAEQVQAPLHHPVASSSSSSSSSSSAASAKNLVSLFEFDYNFPSKDLSAVAPASNSTSPINYSLKKESSNVVVFSNTEAASLKRCSSDEDTDPEVDTVGRRVKERKRIRVDLH